jgi:hypothetical protein
MRLHRDASAILSDDADAEQQDEVIGNETLGVENPVEFQHAPAYVNGHNFLTDDRTQCFACKFCKKNVGAAATTSNSVGMWTSDGLSDAYTEMCQLIDENYGTVCNKELFEMIHEYYETNIRTLHDYGDWSKESIANHVIFHRNSEDVQTSECTALLFAQIQSLRQRAWIKNMDTGQIEPHAKNLHLLEKFVKLLDDHLVKKKTLKK